MRRNDTEPSIGGEWYFTGPFRAAYVGLGLAVAAIGFGQIDTTFTSFLRVVLLFAGLVAAGLAVWWRIATPKEDSFEERSKSAILMALASGVVLEAYFALKGNWDSLRLLVIVFWAITLGGVFLVLLPKICRRIVISLLVLFHFGGILTAVTAVPSGAGNYPWLPTLIWNTVYREYLTFAYLNNAYHFYSPEPGPPSLVWFRVEFEDGKANWLRLVRREEVATRQQYQRMLSLTESVNNYTYTSQAKLNLLWDRRRMVSDLRTTHLTSRGGKAFYIPTHPVLNANIQFREPSDLAKEYLSSYARYVCRTMKHPDGLDVKPRSVKIYRLTHRLIEPAELANGMSPTDATMFAAYFFGEYTPDGTLIHPYFDLEQYPEIAWREVGPDGTFLTYKMPVQDPFLYWMVPIYRDDQRPKVVNPRKPSDYPLIDTLSIHSGGPDIVWDE